MSISETRGRPERGRGPRPSPSRTGLRAIRARVNVRGLHALDRRTAAAQALLGWRAALLADLGGEAVVSAQRMALVEAAVRTRLYVDHLDAWLLAHGSLVRAGRVAGRRGAGAGGHSGETAHHWYHAWQERGRQALKAAGRAGRKPKLGAPQLAKVEQALRAGPRVAGFSTDLWTLPRVAEVIERLTQVRHHPGHVWRLLRGLNWSLQRPARRARERDESAIEQWKTRRWAQLKKTPGAAEPGLSSKMKAASRSSPWSAARGRHAAKRRS